MIPCQRKLLSHQHSCTGFERIMKAIRTSNWLIVLAVVLTPSSVSSTVRDSRYSRELSTLQSMRTPYRCGRGRAYAANVPSTDLRTNTSVTLAGEESTKIHSSLHLALFVRHPRIRERHIRKGTLLLLAVISLRWAARMTHHYTRPMLTLIESFIWLHYVH